MSKLFLVLGLQQVVARIVVEPFHNEITNHLVVAGVENRHILRRDWLLNGRCRKIKRIKGIRRKDMWEERVYCTGPEIVHWVRCLPYMQQTWVQQTEPYMVTWALSRVFLKVRAKNKPLAWPGMGLQTNKQQKTEKGIRGERECGKIWEEISFSTK